MAGWSFVGGCGNVSIGYSLPVDARRALDANVINISMIIVSGRVLSGCGGSRGAEKLPSYCKQSHL